MPDGGGGGIGTGDKPPGLELFKSFDALRERYQQLKDKGYDFEFVLAKYKE